MPKDTSFTEIQFALLEDSRVKQVNKKDDDGNLHPSVQLHFAAYQTLVKKVYG